MVLIPVKFDRRLEDWLNVPMGPKDIAWRRCVLALTGKDWWVQLLQPNNLMDDEVTNRYTLSFIQFLLLLKCSLTLSISLTIDLIFMFLRNKIMDDKSPATITRSFTTVDRSVTVSYSRSIMNYRSIMFGTWKWSVREITYDWRQANTVMKYVNEEQRDYNIPWAIVDAMYVPYNILDVPWILVKIDLVVEKLVI